MDYPDENLKGSYNCDKKELRDVCGLVRIVARLSDMQSFWNPLVKSDQLH
jgi:hypothetical protein